MSLVTRIESAAGGLVLDALTRAQRRLLRAEERVHRDLKGRATPYLTLGNPRRGTVVWLHGFSDRRDTFLPTARILAENYRVIVPAMPGFDVGYIDDRRPHTFPTYAEFAVGFLRDVAGGPVHLVGNSLGGATVLAVASAAPELVRTAIPVNSAGIELEGVLSVADEMRSGKNLFEVRCESDYHSLMRRIVARPMPVPRPLRTHLIETYRAKADWYARIIDELETSPVVANGGAASARYDLASIAAPTLVVWGDKDSLFPLAHGEHVAKAVRDGAIRTLEGVGHCPHLERPRLLANILGEFIGPR
jgi:abhydrolase domain-containing protein 6